MLTEVLAFVLMVTLLMVLEDASRLLRNALKEWRGLLMETVSARMGSIWKPVFAS